MADILHVKDKKSLDAFIDFPFRLYRDDPNWVAPLRSDMKKQFSSKNPFFNHAEIAPFIAIEHGDIVGRIVAILNKRHIEFHKEDVGFFGFFESIDDFEVAKGLLDKVRQWLGDRGMAVMRGPMNFSTNEECAFLLEGFDSPCMLMMPYNKRYYHGFMERYGLRKAKDLYAYIINIPDTLPEKAYRVASIAERQGIKVRSLDMKNFSREMAVFKRVYNSAWEKNWGFVPMTEEEIDHMAKELKPVIVPELAFIAEADEEPVGFMMLLPDLNQVLKRLDGRLFPFGIVKALWYSRRITDLRLLLLGIRQGFRKRGVDALLFREGFKAVKEGGYKRVEFSWILEDNYPVQRLAEMMDGRLYKKYRIYEADI